MAASPIGLRAQRLREGLLLLGFLLLLAAAVVSVVIPELSKEPDEGSSTPHTAALSPKK
jgi:hypothetical protein